MVLINSTRQINEQQLSMPEEDGEDEKEEEEETSNNVDERQQMNTMNEHIKYKKKNNQTPRFNESLCRIKLKWTAHFQMIAIIRTNLQ